MKIWTLVLTTSSLVISTCANSALLGRDLDGNLFTAEAYYDDEANLTWLADASYAMTSGYDSDGRMNWDQANTWALNLTVGAVDGWRLADSLQPDPNCTINEYGDSAGYNCTGSEMGNMFYNVLGGSAGVSITTTHNLNFDLFSNIKLGDNYWLATEYTPGSNGAWRFSSTGAQAISEKVTLYNAWAIHSGDVGAAVVPVPAAAWLFSCGLLGIAGLARRKKA